MKNLALKLLILLALSSCSVNDGRLHGYSATGYIDEGESEFVTLSRPEAFSPIVDEVSSLIMRNFQESVIDITISSKGELRAYTCPDGKQGNIYLILEKINSLIAVRENKVWIPC